MNKDVPHCLQCDVTGLRWNSTGWIPMGPCSCPRGKRLKEERKKGLDPTNKPHCSWCKDLGGFGGEFCNCPEGQKFKQQIEKESK